MNRTLELMELADTGDSCSNNQVEIPIADGLAHNPDLSYLRATATLGTSSSTSSCKYGSPEESFGEEDDDNNKKTVRRKTDSNSKRPWTREENEKLMQLVKQYGAKRWSLIAMHLPGRVGKQCRERWHNHLNPSVRKDAWTAEEDYVIFECHKNVGNQWAEISKMLPGRTDNAIKNRYYSTMRRMQRQSIRKKGSLREGKSIRVASVTSSPVQDNNHVEPLHRTMNGLQSHLSPPEQLTHQQRGGSPQSSFQKLFTDFSGNTTYVDNNAMIDFDRSNMIGSSVRQPSAVYPVSGGTYANTLTQEYTRPLSMTSSSCLPTDDMSQNNQNEAFDYVPMQAPLQRLRSSSPGPVAMATQPSSMSVGMVNSPYGSPVNQMHQQQAPSANFMMLRDAYPNSHPPRGGMYPSPTDLGSTQQYRPADAPPLTFRHKRIHDVQGSQRDIWKNDSPVSVSASIFRGVPAVPQLQQSQVGDPLAMLQSKPIPMPMYRQTPSMGHFANMEHWTDDTYL
ncbi:hypothetical protein PsorP6_000993 [Peronosclerospora sorghi]|uniref:Uncharacterized protein n=1 Tax=Peronosclerospora sorghi TaxID=230839 RepID=A0ACC0WVL0_9STRA|nr:hypothetical protein PsorP6_000993 [Peronosclerospora sorghi]